MKGERFGGLIPSMKRNKENLSFGIEILIIKYFHQLLISIFYIQMSKMPQTTEEKIKVAQELKTKGNELFKQGEFKKAISFYKQVFLYINGLNSTLGSILSQQQSKEDPEVAKLRAQVNMNISFCYYKTQNYVKSFEHIQKCVQIEPENLKARYKRGQLYLMKGDLDNAKIDLEFVYSKNPNDEALIFDLKTLNEKYIEHEKKEKKIFQNMFK